MPQLLCALLLTGHVGQVRHVVILPSESANLTRPVRIFEHLPASEEWQNILFHSLELPGVQPTCRVCQEFLNCLPFREPPSQWHLSGTPQEDSSTIERGESSNPCYARRGMRNNSSASLRAANWPFGRKRPCKQQEYKTATGPKLGARRCWHPRI